MSAAIPTRKPGDIHQWDLQADVFRGSYQLIERVGRNEWVIEELAPSDELIERIFEHYRDAEARGFSTAPVWSKTWAECPEGERPEIVRYKTHAEEMEQEIAERIARTGERTTIKFVSTARYAEMF